MNDRRSDARERALYLLYEAAQKDVPPADVLAAQLLAPDPLTVQLVEGVVAHRDRIDAAIVAKTQRAERGGWTLERMPVLDVNVLRIAAYEMIDRPDVPIAVVIDEAVELAKRFSTDNSGRFVNGILSSLAPELRSDDAG